MRRIPTTILFSLLLGCLSMAQAASPRFEIASVKPAVPGSAKMIIGGPGPIQPSGEYRNESATAYDLIMFAYPETYKLDGLPGWAGRLGQRFAVDAMPPAGAAPPTSADVRLMMQNLLAERFHLKMHVETKEGPVYFLVVAKSGPSHALEPAAASERPSAPFILFQPRFGHVSIMAQAVTMAEFAAKLTAFDRPVIDHTGLTGLYSIRILPVRPSPAPPPPGGMRPRMDQTLGAALKSLGLETQPGTGPVSATVVDHIDEPTPN